MSVEIEAPGTWIRCGSSAVGVLGDVQGAGVALVAVTAGAANVDDEPETYSESARGVLVTFSRAVAELAAHGFTGGEDALEILNAARVSPGQYDAGLLLDGLGY